MSLSDWIISISGGLISVVLTVAGYFIQKWIQTVDESIKDHSKEVKSLGEKVSALQEFEKIEGQNISERIRSELSALRPPNWAKLDRTEEDVKVLKAAMQEKILPQLEAQRESFGAVKLVEDQLREQESKLKKIVQAVGILAKRSKPDQK